MTPLPPVRAPPQGLFVSKIPVPSPSVMRQRSRPSFATRPDSWPLAAGGGSSIQEQECVHGRVPRRVTSADQTILVRQISRLQQENEVLTARNHALTQTNRKLTEQLSRSEAQNISLQREAVVHEQASREAELSHWRELAERDRLVSEAARRSFTAHSDCKRHAERADAAEAEAKRLRSEVREAREGVKEVEASLHHVCAQRTHSFTAQIESVANRSVAAQSESAQGEQTAAQTESGEAQSELTAPPLTPMPPLYPAPPRPRSRPSRSPRSPQGVQLQGSRTAALEEAVPWATVETGPSQGAPRPRPATLQLGDDEAYREASPSSLSKAAAVMIADSSPAHMSTARLAASGSADEATEGAAGDEAVRVGAPKRERYLVGGAQVRQ